MSEILFSFPGSTAEGAPNGGQPFQHKVTVPQGMRVPCLGEQVTIPTPLGEQHYGFRVHVVEHVYALIIDNLEPYTYIVLRYGR
jgi:hypothetical protein